ncbi:hypothetical protein [uncultured Acinetobacter sp.]|uniref:hypothetical protein n=1 Tax=uncultured Acinetobacter sp. TaxID=165433 RepID=UPI00258E0661|nr:hypothetical protein [uncultured Acinetobacter sp.]
MKDKTLKKKINDIVFVICAGGVLYLIVGFLMKTNWLNCPKPLTDLYEIVRDTLTLMAYFLAPAIALVLFSDWRQEYVEKSREQQGREIFSLVKQIELQLNEFHAEVVETEIIDENTSVNMEELYKPLIKNISKLEGFISEFDFEDEKAKCYIDLVKKIVAIQRESCIVVSQMYSEKTKMFDPDQFNTQYEDYANEDFIVEHEQKFDDLDDNFTRNFHEMFDLINELKPLKNSLKVGSVSPN